MVFEFESNDTWYEACVPIDLEAELDWQPWQMAELNQGPSTGSVMQQVEEECF